MSLSTASAAPISILSHFNHAKAEEEEEGASMWALLVASAVLVILGGAFAGLTIA
jgi:metal transporter CNNM